MDKTTVYKEFEFNETKKYKEQYSEDKFFKKINKIVKNTGAKIIYPALLLYTLLIEKDTSIHVKTTIIGALGYLIFPIDCIPDAIIGLGLTDDLGAILVAVTTVQSHITEDIKIKTRKMLKKWIPDASDLELDNLDIMMGI